VDIVNRSRRSRVLLRVKGARSLDMLIDRQWMVMAGSVEVAKW